MIVQCNSYYISIGGKVTAIVLLMFWSNTPSFSLNNGKMPLQQKPFAERFGLALSQSGVAITITSVTDVVAFAVGSISILPGRLLASHRMNSITTH